LIKEKKKMANSSQRPFGPPRAEEKQSQKETRRVSFSEGKEKAGVTRKEGDREKKRELSEGAPSKI